MERGEYYYLVNHWGERMSIAKAQEFIQRGMRDTALRTQLNGVSDQAELTACLEEHGLGFTYPEFDSAYHHLLTLCQTEGQAEYLKEFKMWWDWTLSTLPAVGDAEAEGNTT